MCILFIHADPNPPKGGYRLVVASNRDEYYVRPAKKAFLCPETNIIGGRDMEPGREGGMWLGISIKPNMMKYGTLLSVTGVMNRSGTSGRGPLVFNYLKSDTSPTEFVDNIQSSTYSPFNLLTMEIRRDKSSAYHHSNSPEATIEYHGKQTLAFGNSTPDAPFSKVTSGKKRFRSMIDEAKDRNRLIEELLKLLKSEEQHLPDPELERRAPATAASLSSIFVKPKNGGYGTRTHSVVLVDDECNVEFVEHTMREPIDYQNPEWDVTVIKSQF